MKLLSFAGALLVAAIAGTFAAVTHFASASDLDDTKTDVQTLKTSEAVQDDKLNDMQRVLCAIAKHDGVVTDCP